MRNFVASDGPPHSGPAQSTPLSPVEQLRTQIGVMADCLTRMLDVAADEETAVLSTPYLRKQLDHVCGAYVDAVKIVWELENLQQRTVAEVLGLEADELRELVQANAESLPYTGGEA